MTGIKLVNGKELRVIYKFKYGWLRNHIKIKIWYDGKRISIDDFYRYAVSYLPTEFFYVRRLGRSSDVGEIVERTVYKEVFDFFDREGFKILDW